MVHESRKPYKVSDICGGAFGRMGEKREEKQARGDRKVQKRRRYNARLIGSAFCPHHSEGQGRCGTKVDKDNIVGFA